MEEVGLLDNHDLGFGRGIEPDLSDPEDIGQGSSALGFAEELADLDLPADGGSHDGQDE